MNKRGRPPQTSSDIELVWFVTLAKDRGLTVGQACWQFRKAAGRGPMPEALVRRYHRVARINPIPLVELEAPALRPGESLLAWYFGAKRRRQRIGLGAAILTVNPDRKTSKI
jgi:hypothetical protein